MGNLLKSRKNQNIVIAKSGNNNKAIVQNALHKNTRHEFKVLSIEDVNKNRSKAYNFLTF